MKLPTRLCAVVLLATTIACHKQSADAHFAKANDLFDHGRTADAILEYRAALQVAPKRGDIHSKLADAYLKTGDLRNAIGETVRAADAMPNDIKAQVRAGSMLLVGRAFEDAKSRADKALAIDPKDPDALILRGNAMASLKDLDGALTEYQQALALAPDRDAAYENIATVQTVKGQNKEAEANFRKAIEVAPKSVEARLGLANYLWNTRRPAEAEQSMKDALAIDPTNLGANRALGVFYIASGRAKDAEPYFEAIAKAKPSTAASLSMADYYLYMQRPDDARKILSALATTDDGFAEATTRLASIDAMQGQRAVGEGKLQQVIAKKPTAMPARLLLAKFLVLDGKSDDALQQLKAITKDDPTGSSTGPAFLLMAQIDAAADQREDAMAAYQEALKRQASPLTAALGLAALHMSANDFDKAQTFIDQALVIAPNNPLARTMHARFLLAKGDRARAKTEIEKLQKDYPTAAPVLDLVGSQQFVNKDYEGAKASFTKALAASPRDTAALTGIIQTDLASGRAKDAVALVEQGLKGATPSAEYLLIAARTYGASGNIPKAEELLKQAIQQYPAKLAAYGLLGEIYLTQKRLPEAESEFRELLHRNSKSVPAGTMLGMLLEAENKGQEAEKEYESVLVIDPHAAVAANNLAWRYADSNRNLDRALELAQIAHQSLPDEPHVNDTLGWAYCRKSQGAQAVPFLIASLDKDQKDPSVHYHLGVAYQQAGEFAKAKKALQDALALSGSFDGAAEARKALASIGG